MDDVAANVVLTADTSQYDQAMTQSSQNTDSFGKSVDTLAGKLASLSKSAGKAFLGIAAADTATIVAATAAYAAFEHQMTSLNAQAMVLNKNVAEQKTAMKDYANEVNAVRREFGATTSEATHLVQTISKMKDGTAAVTSLESSFSRLGKTVGESPAALTAGMLQLQKTMGTAQRDTGRYNNQLSVLQARSNSSAEGILNFANSIAPVGRLVNMSQTDIMGLSNAFIKTGQDGFRASNVFTRMMSEIATATKSGSPDLNKYANLVGMTAEQFKGMGGTNQFLSVIESINRAGPRAITTLNRMGYDGLNTVRTITAMSQQSGGIQSEIVAARNADPSAMSRGSEKAMGGIVESLKKMRAQLAQTAESFGSNFAPAGEKFITTMTKMMGVVRQVVDSPLGKLAALLMAVAAPLAAIAGTGLVAAKGLMALSAVRAVTTGAFAQGFRETRSLGPVGTQAMNDLGVVPGVGRNRAAAGPQGQAFLRDSSWSQRLFFNAGSDVSRGTGGGRAAASMFGKGIGYGATGLGWFERNFLIPQFQATSAQIPGIAETGGLNRLDRRMKIFNSPTFAGSMGMTPDGFWGRQLMGYRQGRMGGGALGGNVPAMNDRIYQQFKQEAYDKSRKAGDIGPFTEKQAAKREADADKFAKRMTAAGDGADKLGKSAMTAQKGLGSLAGSTTRLLSVISSSAIGTAKAGAGLLGKGVEAMGINPYVAAAMGGYMAFTGLKKAGESGSELADRNAVSFGSPYITAGGGTPPSGASLGTVAKGAAVNVRSARKISQTDILAAQDGGYKLINPAIKNLSMSQAVDTLSQSMSSIKNDPEALQGVKTDLINQYGADQAERAMQQLMTAGPVTSGPDISSFTKGFTRPGRDNIFAGQSTTKASKSLNLVGDLFKDQVDFAAGAGGVNAARKVRGQQISSVLGNFGRELSGESISGSKGQRKALNKFVFSNFFNIGLSDSEAENLGPTFNHFFSKTGTNETALKTYFEQLVNPTDKFGLPDPTAMKLSAEDRRTMLATQGLPTYTKPEDFAAAMTKAYMKPTVTPEASTLESRLGRMKSGDVFDLPSVRRANLNEGSPAAQLAGGRGMYQAMRREGLSSSQIQRRLGNFLGEIGNDEDQNSQLAMMAQQYNMRGYAAQMPTMSRVGQFQAQTAMFADTMKTNVGGSDANLAAREQATQTFIQDTENQRQYFQQLLYQQREYDVARSRAEEDFNLQRAYAQEDYNLQRKYAEQDFQIQRERAEADFARQMFRNRRNFNLGRKREEQDHHHQTMLMVEAQAKQLYNMYERVKVQRTSSAAWLLVNSADQTKRMNEQEKNLERLRGMGMKDDTIQQMGLTDSNNAQQVSRLVSEVAADPSMIKKFNKEVSQRLKAASRLVKDESSTEWQEFERSFRLSRRRAQDDFERVVREARADFKRNLGEQDDDFRRSMNRQAHAYAVSMNRAEDAYRKSMNRSAEDLERSAKTIDGNFMEMLTKATKHLSGHAQKMAKNVIKEFKDLKGTAGAESVEIMQIIADIMGVEYKPPRQALKAANVVKSGGEYHVVGSTKKFQAQGGVLPGYTPGVDVHKFTSPDGQELNLSGGEAVMVPEWTKRVGGAGVVAEMNRKAKQGMAGGGVWHPGTRSYDTADTLDRAWDINSSTGEGTPVRSFLDGIVARAVHQLVSYGNYALINHPADHLRTLYAHMSQLYVHPGQHVARGEMIGREGSVGNSTGSHLHFEIGGGQSAIAAAGSGGGSTGRLMTWNDVKKERYKMSEAAAAVMSAVHPLEPGMISGILNKYGKKAFEKYESKYGQAFEGAGAGAGAGTNEGYTGGNQAIVRKYMRQFGWNQWPAMYELMMKESGFNNTAQNPTSTAYGMFQFLDGTWDDVGGHKTSDPNLQSLYGMRYIKSRYGSPQGALNWHRSHNWYGNGGIADGPQTIGVGERGPEAIIPLNEKGTDFMLSLMEKMSTGLEGKISNVRGSVPAASTHNEYHYQIDRSTTFSGAITVQAQNPAELITQLQARQRVLALSQPSLGGMR